jgi:hypothetical protein
MELGDADDPMNAWYFGARDELFNYRLMGQHPTMSGAGLQVFIVVLVLQTALLLL